jgi:predicted exporter
MRSAGLSSRFPLLARVALLAATTLGAVWLARLDFAQKISTNVVDLIPADERAPELHALRALANQVQARVILGVLTSTDTPSSRAVDAFVATLRSAPEIAEVEQIQDPGNREALGRFVYENRFTYLLPDYLARHRAEFDAAQISEDWPDWLARRAAAELAAFLTQPESNAFDELVPRDPLLLVPQLARAAELIEPPSDTAGDVALVWARITASPLEEAGQQPVFDAIDRAVAQARQIDGSVSLQWTGVNRFAAASRDRIRAEVTWLNIGSVVGVMVVTALLVRRPWRVLHLFPTVLLSQLGAWVVVTLVFERVHILVFVIGALLTGAAIDYGFHVYLQPPGWTKETYVEKIRRILKPLLASCLTTVIGFSLLWWSDLPLLRHVGVFVAAGLICALGVALLYFGQIGSGPIEPRTAPRLIARGPIGRRRLVLVSFLVLGCAAGLVRLHWHDDIRTLEVPARELQDNDGEVRAHFGERPEHAVYLTQGRDLAEARANQAMFLAWHAEAYPETQVASLGSLLPTRADYESLPDRLRTLARFPQALRDSLEQHGFVATSFEPFFQAWSELRDRSWPDYATVVAELRQQLNGPTALLLNESPEGAWLLTITDHPPGGELPTELSTIEVNQLQTLNRLFERYRRNALHLSLTGLSLVGISVLILYGVRHGVRVFIVPVGAGVVAFGILGWLGEPLNLFHLLGAFLGVCLTHDYAIFASSASAAGSPPPPSIRLAALTTAASFGVLALSRIPVISALGVTVLIMVLVGLAAVELASVRRP